MNKFLVILSNGTPLTVDATPRNQYGEWIMFNFFLNGKRMCARRHVNGNCFREFSI